MKVFMSGCILAASAALIAGCHGSDQTNQAAVDTVTARVVVSRQQQIPVGLRATGTIHAKDTAIISAQVMGRIEQVPVRAGDMVRAGQTLVILDGATLRQSAAQAQAGILVAQNQEAVARANAGLASSTLARYKQLLADKSVSPQEMDEVTQRAETAQSQLDEARAQTEQARAEAQSAQTMLGYTRLVAPFNGVVTARMADPGTVAAPGAPLLEVDREGPLQLQVTVDESAMTAVHLGMKVDAAVDGIAQPLAGNVSEIVPAADPASHSFLVKIDLPPSSQLRAGMYGSAEFANGTRAAILVPRSAVIERGSLNCAYVLDSRGIAQLRYLTLGATVGDFVEVLSGIAPGDQLVDAPGDRDFTGKRIAAQNGVQP